MRIIFLTAILLVTSGFGAMAGPRDGLIDRYFAALAMEKVFEILTAEGIQAGQDIAKDDEAINPSPAWTARLTQIYSPDKMRAVFRSAMTDHKDIETSEAAVAFFESDLGKTIVEIELQARRAMQDDAVEEAARERAAEMLGSDPERISLYNDFIEVNGLIESNVMGALNSNLAFYRGMATSETYAEAMSESFMISTVWGQEPEIRKDMEDWTMNFSVLAYSGLSEDQMQAYIDISETDAGQVLNAALFAGFDAVFEMQSFELGRAMAEFMVGEDT